MNIHEAPEDKENLITFFHQVIFYPHQQKLQGIMPVLWASLSIFCLTL